MKKKQYIKDISDIKYCEEHKRLIFEGVYSDTYKFEDGVWNRYDSDGNLDYYNIGISTTDNLYYYEEESEEQQEATEEDIGKLCKFYDTEADEPRYSVLKKVFKEESDFPFMDSCCDTWEHCRRLSPSEVAEITGYGVTEDGSTFYGNLLKLLERRKKNEKSFIWFVELKWRKRNE